MPIVIVNKDSRQCGSVLPVRLSSGSVVVVEKVCILDKGHDGHHTDKEGSVWVNIQWLMRQRGMS